MTRHALAASAVFVAAALVTTSASGFQSIQSFKNARVVVQKAGATVGSIANGFCVTRGFDKASAYDLGRYVPPPPGYDGLAIFRSVTCRSYPSVTSTGSVGVP